MKKRAGAIGALFATVALAATAFIYLSVPVHASDHQDTPDLASRSNKSADITDVFVYNSPATQNNLVFQMDTTPLVFAGKGTSSFFDPTLIYQFKISHQSSGVEDQVIQVAVSGADANQTFTVYGPAKPNEVGVNNTLLGTPSGTATYNNLNPTPFSNGIKFFAGPRADPFRFDLFAFMSNFGDRLFAVHTSQSDTGPGSIFPNTNGLQAPGFAGLLGVITTAGSTPTENASATFDDAKNPAFPTMNGFAAGTMSGAGNPLGNYACATNPSANALTDIAGGFNNEDIIIEVPKSLLTGGSSGFTASTIGVWATVNSSNLTEALGAKRTLNTKTSLGATKHK
jgi:hypothetical protein